MSVLYDDVVKIWIDDNTEKHLRLERIYISLRASQKTAIRHCNPHNFVNNKRKFNEIQRLIKEEYAEDYREDCKAGYGLEFPEWPYSEEYDAEEPYTLYDEEPQYEDADVEDVPF